MSLSRINKKSLSILTLAAFAAFLPGNVNSITAVGTTTSSVTISMSIRIIPSYALILEGGTSAFPGNGETVSDPQQTAIEGEEQATKFTSTSGQKFEHGNNQTLVGTYSTRMVAVGMRNLTVSAKRGETNTSQFQKVNFVEGTKNDWRKVNGSGVGEEDKTVSQVSFNAEQQQSNLAAYIDSKTNERLAMFDVNTLLSMNPSEQTPLLKSKSGSSSTNIQVGFTEPKDSEESRSDLVILTVTGF